MSLLELTVCLFASVILLGMGTVLLLTQSKTRAMTVQTMTELNYQSRITRVLDDTFAVDIRSQPKPQPCAEQALQVSYYHLAPEHTSDLNSKNAKTITHWHSVAISVEGYFDDLEPTVLRGLTLADVKDENKLAHAQFLLASLTNTETENHIYRIAKLQQRHGSLAIRLIPPEGVNFPQRLLPKANWSLCYPVGLQVKANPHATSGKPKQSSLYQKLGRAGHWEEAVAGVSSIACGRYLEQIKSCHLEYFLNPKQRRQQDWWYAIP